MNRKQEIKKAVGLIGFTAVAGRLKTSEDLKLLEKIKQEETRRIDRHFDAILKENGVNL